MRGCGGVERRWTPRPHHQATTRLFIYARRGAAEGPLRAGTRDPCLLLRSSQVRARGAKWKAKLGRGAAWGMGTARPTRVVGSNWKLSALTPEALFWH